MKKNKNEIVEDWRGKKVNYNTIYYKSIKELQEKINKIDLKTIYSKCDIYVFLGITRHKLHYWKKKKPLYYELVDTVFIGLEAKLIKMGINGIGNPNFIQFYLKNAYKEHYRERVNSIDFTPPVIGVPD